MWLLRGAGPSVYSASPRAAPAVNKQIRPAMAFFFVLRFDVVLLILISLISLNSFVFEIFEISQCLFCEFLFFFAFVFAFCRAFAWLLRNRWLVVASCELVVVAGWSGWSGWWYCEWMGGFTSEIRLLVVAVAWAVVAGGLAGIG